MEMMHLAFASLWLATLLSVGGGDSTPSIACTAAGVFGGAITQCLTADERKPTRKVLIGEILAAGVMGFAAFAWAKTHEPATLLTAIAMGGGGSLAWSKMVKKYQDMMSE